MRTNSRVFKNEVRNHILNIVDNEEGSASVETTLADFENWYGPYEQKAWPNKQAAFQEWMMGLPSSFKVEFTEYGAEQEIKRWYEDAGSTYDPSKRTAQSANDFYNHLVSREFFALVDARRKMKGEK